MLGIVLMHCHHNAVQDTAQCSALGASIMADHRLHVEKGCCWMCVRRPTTVVLGKLVFQMWQIILIVCYSPKDDTINNTPTV